MSNSVNLLLSCAETKALATELIHVVGDCTVETIMIAETAEIRAYIQYIRGRDVTLSHLM